MSMKHNSKTPKREARTMPRSERIMGMMNLGWMIGCGVVCLLMANGLVAGEPATRPTQENAWNPAFLKYEPEASPIVQETTPTADQVNWRTRPAQLPNDPPPPQAGESAESVVVGPMTMTRLLYTSVSGEVVPALLCKPKEGAGPFPVVIAVHGMKSNKAQVCAQVGPELTRRGFAVLAADMPLHGERPGDITELWKQNNVFKTAAVFREAIINVRQLIDIAQNRDDLDTRHGVALAGYSMGSWIGSIAGPADDRIKAMVLMVGGAVDYGPMVSRIPAVAAVDPLQAISHFAPRPLLLLSAEEDDTVTPEMSRRLFEAAASPKRQVWYKSGHLLPDKAYRDAAEWIRNKF